MPHLAMGKKNLSHLKHNGLWRQSSLNSSQHISVGTSD